MPGRPKLTEDQRDPLFRLVTFQRSMVEEVVYGRRGEDSVYLYPLEILEHSARPGPWIVTVPCEYIKCWQERGLVTLGHRGMVGARRPEEPFTSLILNADAIEYQKRMARWPPVRIVLDLLDDWEKDLRTVVLACVVALVTALALKGLGLT